jgi:membrane protein implicated in regulation of membrane protease activity
MILLLAVLLAIFLVPWPWTLVVVALGVVGEFGEIVWGRRLAKRWRPKAGPEAMIGKRAWVVTECRPVGQVRVHGELWEAFCAAGASAGDAVKVTALDELTLVVEPQPNATGPAASPTAV